MRFLSLLSLIICVAACDKDNQSTPSDQDFARFRIKTFMQPGFDTSSYQYDQQGRVIDIQSSASGHLLYSYTDTSVVVQRRYPNGTSAVIETYKLNANGLASLLETPLKRVVYTYDAGGRLTAENETYIVPSPYPPSTRQFRYTNGNCDSILYTVFSSPPMITNYYDAYHTDKRRSPTNEQMGQSFLGKGSTHLHKTMRVYNTLVNGNYETKNAIYEFDGRGRVTKYSDGGSPAVQRFYVWQ